MKKLLSALLSILLVCSMVVGVSAESMGTTYDCENGYTAVKLSHPDTASGEVDGLIEYEGMNDRGQNYSWSSVGFGDYVYVGTCFGAIYQTLQIIAIENGMEFSQMRLLIDTLYNGHLYNGDADKDRTPARSVIVKINTKTYETVIVNGPVKSGGFRAATKMNDKLYFAATGATPYLLEIDPAKGDATQIVCYSETPQSASISTGIRGLTVYKDMLVATMIGNNGAYMVASKNPSEGPESFETICTQQDLLDYPAYHYMDSIFGGSIWDIIEYNGKLYITVVTGKNGNKQAFALFSGEPDEEGNWTYDLIAGNEADGAEYPFGLGSDRSGAANLMVYDGYLYIGGYNDPMVALPEVLTMDFENLYKDLSSPVCLWRLDAEDNIEMVAGEANEVFPEGPVGNMGAGFGSNLNQYVWRMENYNGKLYVGTFDIGSLAYPLMQFANGDVLKMDKDELEKQINYIKQLINMFKPEVPESTDDEATFDEATFDESEIVNLAEVGALIPANLFVNVASRLADATEATFDESEDMEENIQDKEDFCNTLEFLSLIYDGFRNKLPAAVRAYFDQLLNNEKIQNFRYFINCCKYLSRGERGFDLFVSEDGVNFDTITRDGFGDPYNHGCRVFAITDSGLCVGTANPFYGTQVWLLDDGEMPSTDDEAEVTTPDETEPSQPETTASQPVATEATEATEPSEKVTEATPATEATEPSEKVTEATTVTEATEPSEKVTEATEPSETQPATDKPIIVDPETTETTEATEATEATTESTPDETKPSEPLEGLLGDVNLDGKVNIKDVTAIQKHIAFVKALSDEGYKLADFKADGKVNIKDATAIQKFLAKLEY